MRGKCSSPSSYRLQSGQTGFQRAPSILSRQMWTPRNSSNEWGTNPTRPSSPTSKKRNAKRNNNSKWRGNGIIEGATGRQHYQGEEILGVLFALELKSAHKSRAPLKGNREGGVRRVRVTFSCSCVCRHMHTAKMCIASVRHSTVSALSLSSVLKK